MTADEFNDKYNEYLQPRHYGLAIENQEVIEFLDNIFQDLIKIKGFSYAQIKVKYGSSRFYANGISMEMMSLIENGINNVIKT